MMGTDNSCVTFYLLTYLLILYWTNVPRCSGWSCQNNLKT